MTLATNPPQTRELPRMREWESLEEIQEGFGWKIVGFHSRISKEEVESHVSTCWYCPPTWGGWNGMDRKPNPIRRADGLFVWLLLKRKDG